MKILILHKWLVTGGIETVLSNYLQLLGKTHQIDLCISYDLKERNIYPENIRTLKNFQFILDGDMLDKKKYLSDIRKINFINKIKYEIFKLKLTHKINDFLKQKLQDNYDLVIDFSGCLDTFIRQSRFSGNLPPTIRWVHGQLNGNQSVTQKQIKKYRHIFSNHSQIITICQQMAEIISHTLNLPSSLFDVVYNPINIEKIRENAAKPISLGFDAPYLLQVSRLVKGKGHEEMLMIFAQLKQHNIPHKLVIIGDGENRLTLEKLITELHLENDCFLLGEITNPYPYFKNASLFLHTSEHEGLPTVLLESMALGVPVVAMDCPTGPRDILGSDSLYGKLIKMHDQTSFVQAVLDLLNNNELYRHYEIQSLARINDFSMEKVQYKLNSLFEKIIQSGKH